MLRPRRILQSRIATRVLSFFAHRRSGCGAKWARITGRYPSPSPLHLPAGSQRSFFNHSVRVCVCVCRSRTNGSTLSFENARRHCCNVSFFAVQLIFIYPFICLLFFSLEGLLKDSTGRIEFSISKFQHGTKVISIFFLFYFETNIVEKVNRHKISDVSYFRKYEKVSSYRIWKFFESFSKSSFTSFSLFLSS